MKNENENEKLAKCPFCGWRKVRIVEGIKGINSHYVVVCENCGSNTSFEYDADRYSCSRKWNMRV